MQDNAPCHKSAATMDFLADNNITCLEWPPYSPDVNAIENLWAILKEKLRSSTTPTSLADMENRVKTIWNTDAAIRAACEKLNDSMPSRILQMIANKGGAINY
jgi:transposase